MKHTKLEMELSQEIYNLKQKHKCNFEQLQKDIVRMSKAFNMEHVIFEHDLNEVFNNFKGK